MNETGKALFRLTIDFAAGISTYFGTLELLDDIDKSERPDSINKVVSKVMISEVAALYAMKVTDLSIKGYSMLYKALTK